MRVDLFDFDLPPENIALRPARPRDASRLLLTPHEGELARLCEAFGISATGKVDHAQGLATRTGMTVLAKGPDTVLASGEGRIAFFRPASTWLSTAGTGDVLAGFEAASHNDIAAYLDKLGYQYQQVSHNRSYQTFLTAG